MQSHFGFMCFLIHSLTTFIFHKHFFTFFLQLLAVFDNYRLDWRRVTSGWRRLTEDHHYPALLPEGPTPQHAQDFFQEDRANAKEFVDQTKDINH